MAEPGGTGSGQGGGRSVIPEGIWVLNVARSQTLKAAEHTLWIVKDDGRRLAFVSVEIDAEKNVTLGTWNGEYDGGPVEVAGTGILATVKLTGPGEIVTTGTMPGLGEFVERSRVVDGGRRLLVEGEVATDEGKQTYVEDFDWVSPGVFSPQR